MHLATVLDLCLAAELLPDLHGLVPGGADVVGKVGFLVAKRLGPAVLVLFTHSVLEEVNKRRVTVLEAWRDASQQRVADGEAPFFADPLHVVVRQPVFICI